MRLILTFLLVITSVFMFAQERTLVQGKVVAQSKRLEDIYVANLSTKEAVLTHPGGYFEISAQSKDTLMFSGSLFIGYNYVLDDIDMQRSVLLVPLETSELHSMMDEIVITNISSESLGLIAPGTRRYTPAERRLYTATSGGGIIPVSAIVNWISGRTRMLKKAVEYEEHEIRKDKLLRNFSEETIIEDYNIPTQYVEGFAFYASYDPEMIFLLDSHGFQRDKVKSRLGVLALDFLELWNEKIHDLDQSK